MTEEDATPWPPAMFEGMQEASKEALSAQQELFTSMMNAGSAGVPGLDMNQVGAMSRMATFKSHVQSGGRISIPDAEREALDIEEGDIVQAILLPVSRSTE